MKYYMSKIVSGKSFQEVREKVEEELKKEGFGVMTEIDFSATMKKKLDKEYPPHLILGACNPVYADKVVSVEPTISTLLPCNVTLRQINENEIEVATIAPNVAMSVVNNPSLEQHAQEVQEKLQSVLNQI
ncbi:MAG: DUF302 domain-containing protein [Flavobacteriia bacterium]|nr:DUF302 domain-containing protein [Flavobacteriia bacterium]